MSFKLIYGSIYQSTAQKPRQFMRGFWANIFHCHQYVNYNLDIKYLPKGLLLKTWSPARTTERWLAHKGTNLINELVHWWAHGRMACYEVVPCGSKQATWVGSLKGPSCWWLPHPFPSYRDQQLCSAVCSLPWCSAMPQVYNGLNEHR